MTTKEDIQKYPIYLFYDGVMQDASWVKETGTYNSNLQIHHYIKQQDYKRNKQWFDERGIKQKLILLPIYLHEQVHNQAVKNLTDEQFLEQYKISRWNLLFNRRHSEY